MARHSQRCVARDTSFAVQAGACLLGADGKTKVVASSRKVIHALLHFRFSIAVVAQSSAKRINESEVSPSSRTLALMPSCN